MSALEDRKTQQTQGIMDITEAWFALLSPVSTRPPTAGILPVVPWDGARVLNSFVFLIRDSHAGNWKVRAGSSAKYVFGLRYCCSGGFQSWSVVVSQGRNVKILCCDFFPLLIEFKLTSVSICKNEQQMPSTFISGRFVFFFSSLATQVFRFGTEYLGHEY